MKISTALLHHAQGLQSQVALLQLRLACKGRPIIPPSTEPWKDYSVGDYDSIEDYCTSCLINDNAPGTPHSVGLCYLPFIEPGGPANLNGLKAAQEALLNPEDHLVPNDMGTLRSAAKKLIDVMEFYSVKPDKKLVKLAEDSK